MLSLLSFLGDSGGVGKTLYYPGAFTDYLPLMFFAENSSIETIIYTDYCPEKPNLETIFNNIEWDILEEQEITYDFFGEESWAEFNPEAEQLAAIGEIAAPWGMRYILKKGKKKIEFIYLGTDGINTIQVLLKHEKYSPDIIVLQDHGTGGNYSFFGNNEENQPSALYQYLSQQQKLPHYVFAQLPGGATNIWNNYCQVTETIPNVAGYRDQDKALFSLC